MIIKNVILFILTTTLLVLGQSLWKIASNSNLVSNSHLSLIEIGCKTLINPYFIAGSICYVIATALWVYLLGQYEFSKIYPIFVGACVIISILISMLIFKEYNNILPKVLGSCIIIIGIYIITLK